MTPSSYPIAETFEDDTFIISTIITSFQGGYIKLLCFTEGENKMTVIINAETSTKEQLKEIVKLIAELEKEHTCECTLNLVVR